MPNIRRQIVGPLDALGGAFVGKVGLHITASDGRQGTLTRAQIIAHFNGEVGSRAVKRSATIDWIKSQVEAALGGEQVPAAKVTLDFDDTDGSPTQLEVA